MGGFISTESRLLGRPFQPSLKKLRNLLGELRIQFAQDDLELPLAVTRFLAEYVVQCADQNVTTRELHDAYCRVQPRAKLPAISRSVFELLVGPALAERWGLRRSHSLAREGGAKCGYRGIQLVLD